MRPVSVSIEGGDGIILEGSQEILTMLGALDDQLGLECRVDMERQTTLARHLIRVADVDRPNIESRVVYGSNAGRVALDALTAFAGSAADTAEVKQARHMVLWYNCRSNMYLN